MGAIKFGTDGWRAVISEDFTFDNVKKLAQAMSEYVVTQKGVLKDRQFKVVIGYDSRFLSEKYAELIACVMAGNGIGVVLTDRPTPTPSISYAIKDQKLIGGVVITASHNPARYNGVKYKAWYSGSAEPEITKQFEAAIGKNETKFMPLAEAVKGGAIVVKDIIPAHLAFVKKYVNLSLIKKTDFKVLVDSMYGTGNDYIADLLKGGKCKVDTIHNEKNPGFGGINPEPIMPNLKEMADTVKKGRYAIGLATDGDADRLGVCDGNGKVLTGHKVMTLLLLHLFEDKKMKGDVVQTLCGTDLIGKICGKYGLKMHETPVGFKYIAEIIRTGDVLVGGEETGGVAFKGYIPERDGVLSGLLILEMMAMRKKKLAEILKAIDKEYGTYEYKRLDARLPDEKKARLMDKLKSDPPKEILGKKIVKVNSLDGYKFICEDGSWMMMRLSGTEPIVRIYAESPSQARSQKILEFAKGIADSV